MAMSKRTKRARVGRPRTRRAGDAFVRLVEIMAALRSPAGCPWDRKQTHASLRPFLLEETYEALEALDREDFEALPEELGDVLFQCVFHAQLAAEARRFDVADAIESIIAKLVRRHPHVFTPAGEPLALTSKRRLAASGAVVEQWERLKASEQRAAGVRQRVLSGVPRSLPALLRAHEIGLRVAAVGFDWARPDDVLDKIDEEVRELRAAFGEGRARAAEELGDLLFSIANLARRLDLEPESALRAANDKFTRRFEAVEDRLAAAGRSVHESSLAELEEAWAAVKAGRPAARASRNAPTSRARPRSSRRSR